jgi:hypothetical protein
MVFRRSARPIEDRRVELGESFSTQSRVFRGPFPEQGDRE